MERATFAAGCFWGVEELFLAIPGVIETSVGYTGGQTESPTYKEVCTGETGHAEAVEVLFNPEEVSYETLLQVFWENHNPTTLNRQGPDVGTQYRSAIFFHNDEQKAFAEKSVQDVDSSGKWPNPVVTQVVPAVEFHKAEEYHQKYFQKNGGSCQL